MADDGKGAGKFGFGAASPMAAFPFLMPFNFEQAMELNRPALNAVAEVNGKAYENISALNKTWVAFVNRRLKEDFAVPQQLATCKTVQDMMGVYRSFFENAVADYQAEFEAMSKLGRAMTEDVVSAVESTRKR
jgi:hypothetical protein